MNAQVLITGMGVVAPPPQSTAEAGEVALPAADTGGAALWARLCAQASSLSPSPPTRKGLEMPPACVFEKPFKAEKHVSVRAIRKATDAARYAVVAAQRCLEDAVFAPDADERLATSVVLGTCFGCSAYYLKFHESVLRRGPKGANAVLFTESVFNAAPGHVSMANQLHGASLAIAGGEEAGLSAILAAFDRIRVGGAQAAVTGGVEEYSDLVHASLRSEDRVGAQLDGLAGERSGPFAEGAAVLLLQEASLATQHNGLAYAELLGGARARPASPGDPGAVVRAAQSACAQAGVELEEIDLVVGGGGGGPRTQVELAALAELFPPTRSRTVPLTAPQALLGEGFAFTSAALAVVAAQALSRAAIPPTLRGAGLPTPWPEKLRCPTQAAEERALERVLVVATSTPGAAVALVLGRAPQGMARG